MKQRVKQNLRSLMIRIVIVVASIAMAAAAGSQLIPISPKRASDPAAYNIVNTATIVVSPTTIGATQADLYYTSPADINKSLDALLSIGVTNVRIAVPWSDVEPSANQYNWSQLDTLVNAAEARNMAVLAVLSSTPAWAAAPGALPVIGAPDPGKFADFAGQIATRYSGKISAYEVWNEPNGVYFYAPVDPVGYTTLLKAAYSAIKAADPNAIVVGGVVGATVDNGIGMNPVTFVSKMYAAGAKGYFDALSYHPYQWSTGWDVLFGQLGLFSDGGAYPNSPLNQLIDLRALMVANGDANKLIWGTEYGQPSYGVGEWAQTQYISNLLATWKSLDYTGPVYINSIRDDTIDIYNTIGYGLFRLDWTAKPAAYLIRQLITGQAPPPDPFNDFVTTLQVWYNSLQQSFANSLANVVAVFLSWFTGAPAAAATMAAASPAISGTQAVTFAAAKPVDPLAASAAADLAQSVTGSGDVDIHGRAAGTDVGVTGTPGAGVDALGAITPTTGTAAAEQQPAAGSLKQPTDTGQTPLGTKTEGTSTASRVTGGNTGGATVGTNGATTTSTEATGGDGQPADGTPRPGRRPGVGAGSAGLSTAGQSPAGTTAGTNRQRPRDPSSSRPHRHEGEAAALSPSAASAGSTAASTGQSTASSGS